MAALKCRIVLPIGPSSVDERSPHPHRRKLGVVGDDDADIQREPLILRACAEWTRRSRQCARETFEGVGWGGGIINA